MPKKAVIDTNILVSALLNEDGIPRKIIDKIFFTEKMHFCLSEEVFTEYKIVLLRKKFIKYHGFSERAGVILLSVNQVAEYFQPKIKINILKDKSDNKFLELAEEAKADYLITGNSRDFKMDKFKGTKIISPRDFWGKYCNI